MAEQVYPEPTVGALVVNAADEILLVRSHKWRGRFVMPGGHIELGETIEQALHREIREETGLEIRDLQFLGLQEFIYDEAFWKRRHYVFLDYACRTDGTEVTLNDEAQEYAWLSLEEALAADVEPYTVHALQRYVEIKGT